MIAFKTAIFKADFNYNGNIISEEAVLNALKTFKKMPLVLGNTKAIIGVIDNLEYNKETKEVTATIILKAQLNILFNNKNALVIPEGKRILDTEIKQAIFELYRGEDGKLI
jgi:hypothetical protein